MRQALINQIQLKGLKHKEIAHNITSESNLSSILEGRSQGNFQVVLDLVRRVLPEQEQSLMAEYISTLESPQQIKSATDYLSTNRMFGEFEELTSRLSDNKNRSLNEWLRIIEYQMYCQRNSHLRKESTYLEQLCKFKANQNESKAMLHIMTAQHHQYKKEFNVAKTKFEVAMVYVEQLDDSYLKKSLSARCLEHLCYLELKINSDVEKANELSDKLIKCSIGTTFTGFAYYVKGLSHLFISYDKSIKYFNQSSNLYKQGGYINFVKEVQKKVNLLNYIHNKSDSPIIDDGEPLKLFFEAKETDDKDLYYRSMIAFLKQGDSFLATLPQIELGKKGENHDLLNDLITINKSA